MAKEILNDVYASLKAEARAEVLREVQPKIEKLQALGVEIISALSGGAPKRGRKPGKAAGKKPGPKAKAGATGTRTPRGALEAAVREALTGRSEPATLSQLRDAVQKQSVFASHEPKNLYNQVAMKVKAMKDVQNVGKAYTLAAAPPAV